MGVDNAELIARIGVALGLGALIGAEREWRGHPAGVGTHALVALGAAVFTLTGVLGTEDAGPGADPYRIAAQVASGIGFIGAGAIIQSRGSVKGLTTAATLWFAAAVGVATGVGALLLASCAVAATLVVLTARELIGLRPHERSSGGYVVNVDHDGRDDLGLDVAALLVEVPGIVQVETHPHEGDRWRTKIRVRDQEGLEPLLDRLRGPGARDVRVERD